MAGFGGVDELRGAARGGQGGGDLAGDVAAFAHAGDDDAPFSRLEAVDGADKGNAQGSAEGVAHRQKRCGLGGEGVAAGVDDGFGTVGAEGLIHLGVLTRGRDVHN